MASLVRIIKFAFQDLARNIGLSFMTLFILVLMLLSINVLWSVDTVTTQAVQLVKDQVNVSVYLSPAAADKDIEQIKKYIGSFPEVTEIKLVERDEVLASFKKRHQLSAEVLQALAELGGNPFGSTLVIQAREPGDYKKIIQALEVPEYEHLIEAKSFDQHEEAIGRIENITGRVEKLGVGLSFLFAIISFLIIFNTIRVAIQTQRMEISIKRLVGANNWFIRGPYLFESIFFTLMSVLIAAAAFYLALRWIDPYLSVVFPSGFSLTKYYNSHILYLFGTQTLAVLALTILSSFLAMRRQLKV